MRPGAAAREAFRGQTLETRALVAVQGGVAVAQWLNPRDFYPASLGSTPAGTHYETLVAAGKTSG